VLEDWGSVLGTGKDLLFVVTFRPDVGPQKPSVQRVPGVKRPGHESDLSLSSLTDFNNAWSYTSTAPYVFME